AIIGASGSTSGTRPGRAYIFAANGTWSQEALLMASDGVAGDGFGAAVALSGGTALVETYTSGTDANFHRGAVSVYTLGTAWGGEAHWSASDAIGNDNFSNSVTLDDATALVETYSKPAGMNIYQGASYIYDIAGLLNGTCALPSDCATAYVCNSGHCS